MGYRTFVKKQCPVVFVVQNIAPERKRIKLFNYPIANGMTRDLLEIPNVSEDVIRHSLLKGALNIKIRAGEVRVVDSNIELYQFDECQRQFLLDAGITEGITPGGGSADLDFAFKQGVDLIGVMDEVNRTFTTPEAFINGIHGNNDFRILIRHNGRVLVEGVDYTVVNNTTILLVFSPKARSILVADYMVAL
jgi:hypothetical protein